MIEVLARNGREPATIKHGGDVTSEKGYDPGYIDYELLQLRASLTPGQRIQAMLDARELIVGLMRGRLRGDYPELTERELNLLILEEIERGKRIRSRARSVLKNSSES